MIITTSRENEVLVSRAIRISEKYGIRYVERGKRSIADMTINEDPEVFVANGSHGLSFFAKDHPEAFYHPSMSKLRIIAIKNGGLDALTKNGGLSSGMTFFDGTMGLASDTLTAAYIVGESGGVISVEKSPIIHILVVEGMKFYAESDPEIARLIERIEFVRGDNLDVLRSMEKNSVDLAYFDFMFESPVRKSNGIDVIRQNAVYDKASEELIREANLVSGGNTLFKTDKNGRDYLLGLGHGFRCTGEGASRSFYYVRSDCRISEPPQ